MLQTESSFFFFFFIKCKYCIDQKEAGDQQYKEKGTKSLDQSKSKTSLLNKRQREQTPLLNRKTKGTDSLDQPRIKGNKLP
jgi:hypothetical protein